MKSRYGQLHRQIVFAIVLRARQVETSFRASPTTRTLLGQLLTGQKIIHGRACVSWQDKSFLTISASYKHMDGFKTRWSSGVCTCDTNYNWGRLGLGQRHAVLQMSITNILESPIEFEPVEDQFSYSWPSSRWGSSFQTRRCRLVICDGTKYFGSVADIKSFLLFFYFPLFTTSNFYKK